MKKILKNLMIGLVACSSIVVAVAQQQPSAPKAQPSLIPQEKANNPSPSASAHGKNSEEYRRRGSAHSDHCPAR